MEGAVSLRNDLRRGGEETDGSREASDCSLTLKVKTDWRLLLVDPDLAVREALKEAFRFEGFEVDAVAGCNEAMAALGDRRWAIVLVDVSGSPSQGWEAVRSLRMHRGVRVVVMGVRRGLSREAVSAGAVAYWEKPLPVGEAASQLRDLAAVEFAVGAGRATGEAP